ncbi:MAG: hypothetical protein IIU11_06210 [Bacteroidales bacterium]|nr:hypothetical protein [Bacteroidales bacterium]
MSKYLNPKVDLIFKKVFGEHPNLVKSLLNALSTTKHLIMKVITAICKSFI